MTKSQSEFNNLEKWSGTLKMKFNKDITCKKNMEKCALTGQRKDLGVKLAGIRNTLGLNEN